MTESLNNVAGKLERARSLWAKSAPFHPLWCHLIDVAVVAQLLARRFGGVPQLPDNFVALIAGLHDVGKADGWFQNKDSHLTESLRRDGLDLPSRESALLDSQRRFRHEARSAEFVQQWLTDEGWGKYAVPVLQAAIHGHHGSFTTEFIYEEEDLARAYWGDLRRELLDLLISLLQPSACRVENFENASEVGAKLSGLIVLADWIASNHDVYQYDQLPQAAEPGAYFIAAKKEAQAALCRLEFDDTAAIGNQRDNSPGAVPAFRDVWPEFQGKALRSVQSLLEQECLAGRLPPGMAIIEAPMGEGKTEAAVYLAECWNLRTGRRGCYLALPTQATANQMHQRYRRFLAASRPDSSAPRLVHGMAWLIDDVAPESAPQTFGDDGGLSYIARDWFRPARRALLAADGVGTVDQTLMAALNVKFGFLRLLGLSTKTLVIDEVHAYDDFMTTIMERLLEWCRTLHVPVVLLSATLSLSQKQKLCRAYAGNDRTAEIDSALTRWPAGQTPYPLVTNIPLSGRAEAIPVEHDRARDRDVALERHPGLLDDPEQTSRLAAESIANGGCLCVLANTVKGAQAIFERLQSLQRSEKLIDTELMLFHARFPAWRRNEVEEQVTRRFGKAAGSQRPLRAILVATQVVEQSLDVDFDAMLSQIAPVDLLLQRTGRVWRHDRPNSERHGFKEPVLHVLTPANDELHFGASELVYEREILLRTLSLLHDRPAFRLPADFRMLIEGCYSGGPLSNDVVPEDELNDAADKRAAQQIKASALAREHLLPRPMLRSFTPCRASAEEGEGETQSYFVAQTRMGNDSISVLLVEDSNLLAIAKSSGEHESGSPRRDVLKLLFQRKVGLPRWWLVNTQLESQRPIPCQPLHGFEAMFAGGNWLRNQLVLPLRHGEWRGRDAAGREFVIRNDHVLGVYRQPINSEGEASHGQSQEEADAGQLG